MENTMNAIMDMYNKIYDTLETKQQIFEQTNASLDEIEQKITRYKKQEYQILQEEQKRVLERIKKVEAYASIAKTHYRKTLQESLNPIAYNPVRLSQLSVQTNNGNYDDPAAYQLYVEATGQLLFLSQEGERLRQEFENKCKKFVQNTQKETEEHVSAIRQIEEDIRLYLCSEEFLSFMEALRQDKVVYGGIGESVEEKQVSGKISLGTIGLRLPISSSLKHLFQEIAKDDSIGIPVQLTVSEGTVLIAEYENLSEAILLKGIQNLLLNIAKYYSEDYDRVAYFDPVRYNASSLGCLSQLAGEQNMFIDKVPNSKEDVKRKVDTYLKGIKKKNQKCGDGSFEKEEKSLVVFHNFPHAYATETIDQIYELCVNAKNYSVTVILTHNVSSNEYMTKELMEKLEISAMKIVANEGKFFFDDSFNKARGLFKWYQAPTCLPKSIEKKYMEEKTVINLSNDYVERVGFSIFPRCEKGVRNLQNIPYGIDSMGNVLTLDFEGSNFATYICGAARSGKSTLLHTIISGLIQNNHPDDIELWLIDFNKTEFSQYINHRPPHVRYIVLDHSPELVYDIIDRLTEIMYKRQNVFQGKWQKLSDVPAEKYMPAIMVIIDEFSAMSQILEESMRSGNVNYVEKLQNLLSMGAKFGFHFIFASQGFTKGTRGLSEFAKEQIQQRISMKASYGEIKETLELKMMTEEDSTMMEQLSPHYALVKISSDEEGNYLKKAHVLHISDKSEQADYIEKIKESITSAPKYDNTDPMCYIHKKPLSIDGNTYIDFALRSEEIQESISEKNRTFDDEVLLYLGEPRRMMNIYPVRIYNEFCENILSLAPITEKMSASSIVMSVARSLNMQDCQLEVWTNKKNPIYRQTCLECEEPYVIRNTLEDICEQIKTIKEEIQSKREGKRYILLLGFESLLVDMSFQETKSFGGEYNASELSKITRKEDELDMNSFLDCLMSGKINLDEVVETEDETTVLYENMCYDARDDLNYILTYGPRLGYHFIMMFSTVGDIKQSGINMALFKHKILFRTARMEAVELTDRTNAELVEHLDGHSFRYTNGLEGISFRPFLHPGISWDGWKVDSGNDDEEEYLM